MNNKRIIKEFLQKMNSQDNRCTAAPYFYVIRTQVEIPSPTYNCDYTRFYWNSESYDNLEDIPEEYRHEAHEYGVTKGWENKGMFLTEEDAEDHLKKNHYHYSDNAHTYVSHAWRAPRLNEFFMALFDEYEIEHKNWRI